MKKIVFVLHEASRTGAPFTQLHLMRWLKRNTNYQMMLVLLQGGDLVEDFEKLAEVVVVNRPYVPASLFKRIYNKINRLYRPDSKKVLDKVRKFNPDLIFSNSAVAVSYAALLKAKSNAKLVSYLHELETTFFYISPEKFKEDAKNIDAFIMGSQAVSDFYHKKFAIPATKLHVIYDFIAGEEEVIERDIRQVYNIPSDVAIIGAMASITWRKGPELFIEVARRVVQKNDKVVFMWVGGKKTSYFYQEVFRDVRLLDLEDKIIMAGEQVDIHSYYKAFDTFLLTSREDPFPLVCLESALAHTPIICFAEAGGMPEFVRDDAGFVVPYLDLDAMADRVIELLNNPELRRKQAKVAHDRVLEMCTIDIAGPKVKQLLEHILA